MTEQTDKIKWLQYVNTFILAAVLGLVSINFSTLNTVKNDNIESQKELLRIKTVQDYNTANIKELQAKVNAIETYQQEIIKSWVDQNYIRKAQR